MSKSHIAGPFVSKPNCARTLPSSPNIQTFASPFEATANRALMPPDLSRSVTEGSPSDVNSIAASSFPSSPTKLNLFAATSAAACPGFIHPEAARSPPRSTGETARPRASFILR
ncbi:MAG: hypothetical protein EDM74_12795 [Armatimonadetes bacterium]|nr:MAG: hypothetical protein EDM74_12795 [Armatimonadota bacterium]